MTKMVRAGSLLLNPALETNLELRPLMIAETGVWETTYRAALELQPVADRQFAIIQVDILEVMRLSVDASAGVRAFAMAGNEAGLSQALPNG
jgi:hypothetical protein